jgi:hypothetical protein
MQSVLILGIGTGNYNHRKITGWKAAFQKKYNVIHVEHDDAGVINQYIANNNIDIVFGESHQFLYIDLTNIKTCVIWHQLDIRHVLNLSERFPKTKFILANKSIIHNTTITENYISKFGPMYQVEASEGQNLQNFINAINNSQKIDENTFKISDNIYFIYLPLCLSEMGKLNTAEYDLCYFGSTHNRPRVIKILDNLKSKGYRVVSNHYLGHLNPETCFDFYSKTICTISEQIHPILMEYPVRLGESSANGCKFFLYDDLNLIDHKSSLVPNYNNFKQENDIEMYINEVKSNPQIRSDLYTEFSCTFNNGLKALEEII